MVLRTTRRAPPTVAWICLCCLLQPSFCVTPLSEWISGIATNYGGPADGKSPYDPSWGTIEGSCGYGLLDKTKWPYWSVAALSTSSRFFKEGPLQACGECFEVTCVDKADAYKGRCILGPNKVSVIVQVTDSCPECEADHMDIQALTFKKLAPMEVGKVNMLYRRVQCVPPKPIQVIVDNNSGAGNWLRLFVTSAGGAAAIRAVQVRHSGSADSYQTMQNKWGSSFELANAPQYPLDINIIGADGESVTAYQVINNGQTGAMPTNVQFKIANPAEQALEMKADDAAGSPSPGSTSSPGSSPSSGSSPSPAKSLNTTSFAAVTCVCTDDAPDSNFTCQQQKDFNACGQPWMLKADANHPNGFCQKTCGRCKCGRRRLQEWAGLQQPLQ